MTTLTQANRQWANRPSDERFTSLIDLDAHCANARARSAAKVLPNRALTVQPDASDEERGLLITGPNGNAVAPSHWAFGQLAQRAGAPAAYLRDLPAPLAADCLNFGLRHTRDVEELGVLLRREETGAATLAAVTGPNYGRIWNNVCTSTLVKLFGSGLARDGGDWQVPQEYNFGGKSYDPHYEVTKQNTTLYASDRDMWVFLADENHRIEVPNRRNGQSGSLARGFMLWNSEVGAESIGVAAFYFDGMCGNHLIWGAEGFTQIRLRHTAGAPNRWIEELTPALETYSQAGTVTITKALAAARAARIDNVDEFLRKRFSNRTTSAIKAAHMTDEDRPIETLWDAATAVTAYARSVPYMNERVDLEREGGRILDMAA